MTEKEILFYYTLYKPEDKTLENTRLRFFKNAPEIDEVYVELHSQVAYIFSKLNNLCRENNISYFLMGGSCIGAIRSGKIIPWDLDGDIGMLRKDYLKLKEVIKSSKEIELIEVLSHAKVCNEKSEELVSGFYKRKIIIKDGTNGISVDIILWDQVNIPNNQSLSAFQDTTDKFRYLHQPDGVIDLKRHIELKVKDYLDTYGGDNGKYMLWSIDTFKGVRGEAATNPRIHLCSDIYPTSTIKFLDDDYQVCKDLKVYIENEWGDIWSIQMDTLMSNSHEEKMKTYLEFNRKILNDRK